MTGPQIDDLVSHHQWSVNGLDMHVAQAGDGPLVVLLHGFPDFWYSWRRQIPALVAAGFRVLAPDLRGYAGTQAPRGVEAYRLEHLVDDVVDLVAIAGETEASLVGHDWGGIVAWTAAAAHPEHFDRLAVCNIPHPRALRRVLRHPRQLLRSWYTYAFQAPLIPEFSLRARDGWLLRRVLRSAAARTDSFSEVDLDLYVDQLLNRGDLTGPINYYRAAARAALPWSPASTGPMSAPTSVHQPVLVQWGERDHALIPELASPPRRLVPNARTVRYPDAGHWVHLDQATDVNAELLRFLGNATRSD